jgi:uncharacterized repeat protein (TIGR01451 family)
LYGVVTDSGQAQAGVIITATLGDRVVAGTTYTQPGAMTPTYGIDISPLEPKYLQPVTLTAYLTGRDPVTRQVVVIPNYSTHSQRYDINLSSEFVIQKAGRVSGYVFNYADGTAVAGAVVSATYNGQVTSTTTITQRGDPYPAYVLDLSSGSTVTLTAAYKGFTDRKVVSLGEGAREVNFVVGRMCDGAHVIPPQGSHFRELPDSGGSSGLPDEGCFWGYVRVNGALQEGALVEITISDTVYAGATQWFPGEEQPRYGIPIWGRGEITGKPMTVTAVYQGAVASQRLIVTLDDGYNQRVDLAIASAREVTSIHLPPLDAVRDLLWHAGDLWWAIDTATPGIGGGQSGVVRYGLTDQRYQHLTSQDGLASNHVSALAVGQDGALWFATDKGVSRYLEKRWKTFTTRHGLFDNTVHSVTVDPRDGSLWFGAAGGLSHYFPRSNHWETFTISRAVDAVTAIAVAPDHSLWFNVAGGILHFRPRQATWEMVPIPSGIGSKVTAIAVGQDGSLWVGTNAGIGYYRPQAKTWEPFTQPNLLYTHINKVTVQRQDGSLWFGADGGVSHYLPALRAWAFFTPTQGTANRVTAIAADPSGAVWFGTAAGVSRWQLQKQQSDLQVTLAAPERALVDKRLTYILTVRNLGQRPASNSRLTLTLPPSSIYVSASRRPDTPPPGSQLVWSLGRLAAQSTPVTLTVTIRPGAELLAGYGLTTTALVTTSTAEAFLRNNHASITPHLHDPWADVRVALDGPPQFSPGQTVTYQIWVDNVGGQDAKNTRLKITLPPGLTSSAPLLWNLGTLPATFEPTQRQIILPVQVGSRVAPDRKLTVRAEVSTASEDRHVENNRAIAISATSLDSAQTLFLLAPERLVKRYGATSLFSTLHRLARHLKVAGVILNVQRDADVAQAYRAWDAAPDNIERANQVADAIKRLIDHYTGRHPTLRYLVLVGGDDMIPFYRVADGATNLPLWRERDYTMYLPNGTVKAALQQNQLLTDDFYAGRPLTATSARLYLPDFAIGRLVETPEEISATIGAFLRHDGVIRLGNLQRAVVGYDGRLTVDLGKQQCSLLDKRGVAVELCSTQSVTITQAMSKQLSGLALNAQHSSHLGLGRLPASKIPTTTVDAGPRLLLLLGCHAGLNVPPRAPSDRLPLPDHDLVQAFLGNGGVVIGSSAYAYASDLALAYAEVFMRELTERLLRSDTQPLGVTFIQTKHWYFTSRAQWFDDLDAKVLLPATLYGLPMWQVGIQPPFQILPEEPAPVTGTVDVSVTVSLGTPHSRPITTTAQLVPIQATRGSKDYVYYVYRDQDRDESLAQIWHSIQPAHQITLPVDKGRPRGVVLHRATYQDPVLTGMNLQVVPDIGVVGAQGVLTAAELLLTAQEWDRALPYSLGVFRGLPRAPDSQDMASVNLILGAFSQAERLFTSLQLEVLYSDSEDWTAPAITFHSGTLVNDHQTVLRVEASDEATGSDKVAGIAEVIGVCEGDNKWLGISLEPMGGGWGGACPLKVARYYIQVIDHAGNVTVTLWTQPSTGEPN